MLNKTMRRRSRGDRGASLVEYALLVAVIAVVCIGAVTVLGKNSSNKMSTAGDAVGGSSTPVGCEEQQDPYTGNWAHRMTPTSPILPGRCP